MANKGGAGNSGRLSIIAPNGMRKAPDNPAPCLLPFFEAMAAAQMTPKRSIWPTCSTPS